MEKKIIIDFLKDLSASNNKVWFDAHKGEYLKAKETMELFVNLVIAKISDFDQTIIDQEAKKCVFRIYRDTRFAKNKEPYKTNMGGFIVPGGKKSGRAGYYVHIEPGSSFIAGGVYAPESQILKLVREEVMYNIDEFNTLINGKDFVNYFGEVNGEKLKRPPKGFPADFADIELLKFKSYTVMHAVTDEQVLQEDFADYAANVFRTMMPFNKFINRVFD